MGRMPRRNPLTPTRSRTIGDPLDAVRHSLAHLLAMAVLKKFPTAKLGIGPTIESGFYYDFKLPKSIGDADLKEFEATMRELIAAKLDFKGQKVTPQKARALFRNQPFKLDLIKDFVKEKKQLTAYTTGEKTSQRKTRKLANPFTDLCRGGHVKNTSEIHPEAFALTKIAGAYWRGSEKNPQLTRIYGLAFATKKELDEHMKMLAEAERRDHKRLGPQLGLFLFHETAPGMPYWLPHGVTILNELIGFWRREHEKRGYQEIKSPLLNKRELYETSGHWAYYHENMFVAETDEGETYGVKAMNCPNAMVVFASRSHSYRDLPLRLSDTDTLHRYERSGTLNGLLRVRSFSQDDAHIFITPDQIRDEYRRIFEITERFYSVFNLPYAFRLGTRPEKFMGDAKTWTRAESALKEILVESGKSFTVLKGDGAFYGPKVDILIQDALGREWQMGTIQLDFQIPRRFDLAYTDADGKKKTPVVIHRVIYGSLERFIGVLIEHFAGAFPLWLAPVQVALLAVTDGAAPYVREVERKLAARDWRTSRDERNETIGRKIREAELQKIPYLLVIGEREAKARTVAVRERGKGDRGQMQLGRFLDIIQSQANP